MSTDSTERFSDRVDDYIKTRPSYPEAIVETLEQKHGLVRSQTIADVGCGTGISSELFLRHGYRVIGVEPNAPMRSAAEKLLKDHALFESTDGDAGATGLRDESVDLVLAAQAFHWFDPARFRKECLRIARKPSLVALVWNERDVVGSDFLVGYELILRNRSPDYARVAHQSVASPTAIRAFLGEHSAYAFANAQRFDEVGFLGRVLSSSYVPAVGHAGHQEIMDDCRDLFARTCENGLVNMTYSTRLYVGPLSPGV